MLELKLSTCSTCDLDVLLLGVVVNGQLLSCSKAPALAKALIAYRLRHLRPAKQELEVSTTALQSITTTEER